MDLQAIIVRGVRAAIAEYQPEQLTKQVQVHKELIDMMNEMGEAGQFRHTHTHRDESFNRQWVCAKLTLYNNGAELSLSSSIVQGEFKNAYPLAVRELYEKFQTAKRLYSK